MAAMLVEENKAIIVSDHIDETLNIPQANSVFRQIFPMSPQICKASVHTFLLSLSVAQKGYLDVAKVLLENSADVNFQSKSGKTPLMMASFSGTKSFGSCSNFLFVL